MPEVREVFHMATQKVRPDPGALERQHRDQRRRGARQKAAVFVLVGALVIGGAVFGITTLSSDDDSGVPLVPDPTLSSQPTSPSSLPTVTEGPLEPGRYVISTSDPDFNASHQITIDVPEGYRGWESTGVFKDWMKAGETGVAMWSVDGVYTDACDWRGTRSAISSADDLTAALAGQEALRPSKPGDVTIDGLAATFIELTTPSLAKVSRCDGGRFTLWSAPGGGLRYLNNPGEHEILWILDVDGAVLVINAMAGADVWPHDDLVLGEVLQMVDSIRIDPGEEGSG